MQGVDCHGVPPFLITPRDALGALNTSSGAPVKLTYAAGCKIDGDDASAIPAAVAAAGAADVTVVVAGLDRTEEYEMRDRTSLLLPQIQRTLVSSVAAAAAAKGSRCVVGLISGGVLDVAELRANPNVSAVLWMGYPGQAGGQALAQLLTGAAVPSGRAPLTWCACARQLHPPLASAASSTCAARPQVPRSVRIQALDVGHGHAPQRLLHRHARAHLPLLHGRAPLCAQPSSTWLPISRAALS